MKLIILNSGLIMKRINKIIGITLCMLILLAAMPLSMANSIQITSNSSSTIGMKRTFVSGFILGPPHPALGGMYMYFFAISMRAGQIGGDYHIYRLQAVFVRAEYRFHGIAVPGFILGWFDGPLGLLG